MGDKEAEMDRGRKRVSEIEDEECVRWVNERLK